MKQAVLQAITPPHPSKITEKSAKHHHARNKTIYGFDLLKFIMALLIVSIHTQAFLNCAYSSFFTIIQGWCVPTFFFLSSYFLMKKIVLQKYDDIHILAHFLKRLGILYGIWFILNLPIYIFQHFITQKTFAGMTPSGIVLDVVKQILFSSTFDGSWFLSALAVSTCIIVLLINLRVNKWIIFAISLSVYLYVYAVEAGLTQYTAVYNWYTANIYDIPTLSFPRALPFISLGYIMASPKISSFFDNISEQNYRLVISFILLALAIVGSKLANTFYIQFITIVAVPLIVIYFYSMKLPHSSIWRTLRDCSILFYLLHFMILIYMRNIPIFIDLTGLIKYIVVLLIITPIAFSIVILSKRPRTKFLKYLY